MHRMLRLRALCTFLLIALAIVTRVRCYCNVLDHQACDELCKVDSYWYGHCTAWDGKNFSCKCFDYPSPLDGKSCIGKHSNCARKCKETGSEGGFCYPQRDRGSERRRTGCECFKDVPPLLKRRKRSYNHVLANKRLT
ncbi:unnamed protein product [Cylicocyclus nassatus]|uniref:Uncharacterized protein n=1 Tax=Cylicocyclus nassatus TaxID=53992 RepID=A0AA36MFV5_CYLNA|nr:unnamed protein product [Cylicocyclus nassatus]